MSLSDELALPPAWVCAECGADLDGMCRRPRRLCGVDAALVVARLEEAGRTLLALRGRVGPSCGMRSSMPAYVQEAAQAYGYGRARVQPALPSAAAITRMDEAWTWLQLIPQDRFVLRRVVGARSLVDPLTGRHLTTWRKLGVALGADHKAVQRWHSDGVRRIVSSLTQL